MREYMQADKRIQEQEYSRKYGRYSLDKRFRAYLELMRAASNWHKTRVYKIA
jgi:hypothetical protein